MKFVRISLLLGLFVSTALAQSDFVEEDRERAADNVDGMFDDEALEEELEPLNEEEIERPVRRSVRPSNPRPVRRPSTNDFNNRSRLKSSNTNTSSNTSLRYRGDKPSSSERLRMDFVEVNIEEVIKYFAERLRKKFIYDPSILNGKITIISPTEVTVDEAWAALLSAMEIRGFVIYPSGPYLKIEKVVNARKSPVPLYNAQKAPGDDSYITRIITPKYLSVGDIRNAVRDLLSRSGGDVIEHAPTNTLIISDYASNIRRIVKILNILDVEGFSEQIEVVTLNHASATDIARKVTEFFPQQTAAATRRSTRRTRRSRSSIASSSGNKQEVIQKVVADERTNSIIILGSERGIEQVRSFIERVDIPIEGGGGQIHVYPLQNVKAEDISQTLASLTSGKKATISTTSASSRSSRNNPANPSVQTVAELLGGEVKITADSATNSLVIQASPRDYEVLKQIIQKLDIRRRQVFIESVILEASTSTGSRFGTQGTAPLFQTSKLNQGTNASPVDSTFVGSLGSLSESLDSLLLNPSQLTGLALGFRSGGTYSVNITDAEGNSKTRNLPLLSAIVRLSAGSNSLNVLSTPHILATANEEATIEIGEEIPQLGSTQTASTGLATQNFTRLKVATELTITPQVNAGDYLTLNIQQKIDEVGGAANPQTGQVPTINRQAKTTVIVKDGQTIVIGGLMRDRKREQVSKVPFLGDIPILGWLFKSKTTDVEKVNLLLFITPHIIRDTADSDDVFFKKLKQREDFMEKIGMEEKSGIPISGYSKEQLDFLDDDYVKSLHLRVLPVVSPERKEEMGPDIQKPQSFDGLSPPAPAPTEPVDNGGGLPMVDDFETAPLEPIQDDFGQQPNEEEFLTIDPEFEEPQPVEEPNLIPLPSPTTTPSLEENSAPLIPAPTNPDNGPRPFDFSEPFDTELEDYPPENEDIRILEPNPTDSRLWNPLRKRAL